MRQLQTFRVFPKIPDRLAFLETLSRNLWWCWKPHAMELFRRIDPGLWKKADGNPILFLSRLPQARLEHLAKDESFISHMDQVREAYETGVVQPGNGVESSLQPRETIAYFSMEFGLHESVPLFAGGLGVLAGDHLKAASNLGISLTGVGLLYRQGYFRQFLDRNGWQQEAYPETDLYNLPLKRMRDENGNELIITVAGPDGDMHAGFWKIMVGRITLYLLDTNLKENPPGIRQVTANLYAGDSRTRLAQEALLGIGGIRLLETVGLYPKVCHLNEGHSAFSSLERLALFMRTHGIDLPTALEIIPRSTIFTTHTPVPAGHDEFTVEMVKPVIEPFKEKLGASETEILSWGQPPGARADAPVSMFILGARMAQFCNGVSRLHGSVARRMWTRLWPGRPEDEIPITHVTNGVHSASWMSPEFALLLERYVDPRWHLRYQDRESVARIDDIYDDELWRAHEMNRTRLITTCREKAVQQCGQRNEPAHIMADAATVLEQGTLTICFARRFAAYKRANLLLTDPDRLEAILSDNKRPVQIIFAGKAHPRDNEGKGIIRQIVEFSRRPAVRHKVVFLENYDMQLARLMTQGADVWLNTPRRPMEACGTSGMKAAINGCLNLSIMDGWWAEGYSPEAGWAIGRGDNGNGDWAYEDNVDAQALYNVLENQVIPAFYNRQNGAPPSKWIGMMRASMKVGMLQFCATRMVSEYDKRFYRSAVHNESRLCAQNGHAARRLADQQSRLKAAWGNIHLEQPVHTQARNFRVGDVFEVTAGVHLAGLDPQEVNVELYYGHVRSIDSVATSRVEPMRVLEDRGNGDYLYGCAFTCPESGRFGFTARITPAGDDWVKNTPGLVAWARMD